MFGTDRPAGTKRATGNRVGNPTLFADVDSSIEITQETIFGLLLALILDATVINGRLLLATRLPSNLARPSPTSCGPETTTRCASTRGRAFSPLGDRPRTLLEG